MRLMPTLIAAAATAALGLAVTGTAQVHEGDFAPLFVSVDQNMRRIDMADAIDGRPLVFWATSAT